MSEEKVTKVSAYEWEQYAYGDAPPKKLGAFVAWITTILNSIPQEYRESASIEISANTSYDSANATVEVSYWRPQTEEEKCVEEAKKAAKEAFIRDQELRQLAALKARYEK